MARRKTARIKHVIESYQHTDKDRLNNPPVGLVTPDTDPEAGNKTYAYDPHLDPQLVCAGKAEHTSFQVPTVSLHVHERIDPRTIVDAVRVQRTRLRGRVCVRSGSTGSGFRSQSWESRRAAHAQAVGQPQR